MFRLHADSARLRLLQRESITSGSQNTYVCQFTFDESWSGLDITAVFRAGSLSRMTTLDSRGRCTIPWEVLEKPCLLLRVGITGSSGEGTVRPTLWADLELILPGARKGPQAAPPPTDFYAQIHAKASAAEELARSLREDADNGRFNGAAGPAGITPQRGVDYWTEADQAAMLAQVLDALPAWTGGVY